MARKRYVDHSDDPDKIASPPPLPTRDSKGKLLNLTPEEIAEAECERNFERREMQREKFYALVIAKMEQFKMTSVSGEGGDIGAALIDAEARRRSKLTPPEKPSLWPSADSSVWTDAVRAGKWLVYQYRERDRYLVALKHDCGEVVHLEVRGRYAQTFWDSRLGRGRNLWGRVDEESFTMSISRLVFAGGWTEAVDFVKLVKHKLFL